MADCITLFLLETRRFFSKKRLIILVLVLLLGIYVVHDGIRDFEKALVKSQDFQKLDALKVKRYISYTQYMLSGVKYFFVPSLFGKFLKPTGATAELSGRVDSNVSLDIMINGKSGAVFEEGAASPFRLSFIVQLLGGLFVLFLGGEVLHGGEFLQSLCSVYSRKKVFISLVLSRILLLTFTLLCLFFLVLLVMKLHGIQLSNLDISALFSYFKAIWLMILFFFLSGVLVGSIRKEKGHTPVLLTIWIILVFFVPGGLNSYISKKAEDITSSYRVEFEQLGILNDFEKQCEEKYGKFNKENIEIERKNMEKYCSEDYKKIEELENRLKNEIAANMARKRKFSIFTPTTFVQMVGDEVSGYGSENYLRFYTLLQKKKKELLMFYIDHVYYGNPNEIVSFITEENPNLFFAYSTLPEDFSPGFFINLGYCVVLFFLSYYFFTKQISRMPEKEYPTGGIDIELDKYQDQSVWLVEDDDFKNLLYNLLSGKTKAVRKSGFRGEISIDDVDIVKQKTGKTVFYVPKLESIPGDIKVKHLIAVFAKSKKLFGEKKKEILNRPEIRSLLGKPFGKLNKRERFDVVLALTDVIESDIYLIDDIASGLPVSYSIKLKDRMTALKAGGALPVYLTTTDMVPAHDLKEGQWFEELESWEFVVEGNRRSLESKKRKKKQRVTSDE